MCVCVGVQCTHVYAQMYRRLRKNVGACMYNSLSSRRY